MNALLIFGVTFLLVFMFGFVTSGTYRVAFMTTFAIGVGYLLTFRYLPVIAPWEVTAYLLGSPCGIVASMWVRNITQIPTNAPRRERLHQHLSPASTFWLTEEEAAKVRRFLRDSGWKPGERG